MLISGKYIARGSAVILLALTSVGCQTPAQPVTTVWQRLGIPQAATRLRDGVSNRTGNRPGLERRPPVLRLADPANLESEIPAIKAAAEIKMAEDLKQQKIKALKYLATIGCGCYDKEGMVEQAILDALDDCTEDVRIQAAETVAEAAGTCNCKYDGCAPSCCTPAVVKRLYAMAYEADDKGCPIEPSCDVRKAAARAVRACSAVPQPVEPEEPEEPAETEEPVAPDDETLRDPLEEDDETLREVDVEVEAGVGGLQLAPSSDALGEHRPLRVNDESTTQDYWRETPQPLSAPNTQPDYSYNSQLDGTNRDDMVAAFVRGVPARDRAQLQLDSVYEISVGDRLLVLSNDGRATVSEIVKVDGASVEISSDELKNLRLATNSSVFVGLLAY